MKKLSQDRSDVEAEAEAKDATTNQESDSPTNIRIRDEIRVVFEESDSEPSTCDDLIPVDGDGIPNITGRKELLFFLVQTSKLFLLKNRKRMTIRSHG